MSKYKLIFEELHESRITPEELRMVVFPDMVNILDMMVENDLEFNILPILIDANLIDDHQDDELLDAVEIYCEKMQKKKQKIIDQKAKDNE